MSLHFEKARILINQGQLPLAERELREGLSQEPDDAMSHALLAIVLMHQKKDKEALNEAETAIGLTPASPFCHYILALVHHGFNRHSKALKAIEGAIALDPDDAEFYGLLSSIYMAQYKWKAALQAAEDGLAIDPEDTDCINLRANALIKLGRNDEASDTINGALEQAPENARAHANQGWNLLHQGKAKAALPSFKEALRLDPNLEWARVGIIEALKATNPLYRVMLAYFLWMMRMQPLMRIGIIVGLVVLSNILSRLGASRPALEPFIIPLLITYGIFVLLTWIAHPVSNLLLRLNRFGRLALSEDEKRTTNWVGSVLGLAIISGIAGAVLGNLLLINTAILSGAMTIPVATTCRATSARSKNILLIYTIALTLIAIAAVAPVLPESNLFSMFFWGWAGFTWISNAVLSME